MCLVKNKYIYIYIPPQIGDTTSYISSAYFYEQLVIILVYGSEFHPLMVYDSMFTSGVIPLYFDSMGVNYSSILSNYQNNFSIRSDM